MFSSDFEALTFTRLTIMEDYFAFQPFGAHNDDDPNYRHDEALPTPAAFAGYLSPLDSPRERFPDPETPKQRRRSSVKVEKEKEEAKGTKEEVGETRKKPVLSPSELVTVLDKGTSAAPPPLTRFLHGGQPLNDLEAPSINMPQQENDKPVANSEWRAFTDEEERRLQDGWIRTQELREEEKREREAQGNVIREEKDGLGKIAEDASDPVADDPPHLIPVGLDNLFTVDLQTSVLFPAFWTGSKVRLIRSTWFYAPPAVTPASATLHSHQLKPYPVDPSLSSALDRAYATIRPWDDSYEAELKSALKEGSSDSQKRLCIPLGLENESGADASADLGIEVIFESAERGRVYSKGMISSLSKSFWRGNGLGGGQIVLRGWDAFVQYIAEQAEKKKKKEKTPSKSKVSANENTASDTDSDATGPSRSPSKNRPRTRTRTDSNASQPAKSEATTSSGFFSSLRNRFVGTASSSDGHSNDGDVEGRTSIDSTTRPEVNETAEALDGPRKEDAPTTKEEEKRTSIGEVDELCLVVHGIGQQLAVQYESFSFSLAVNKFRSACTTLSTSPTLSPLLHGKRAQFIPINWRTDLDLGIGVDQSGDSADEQLTNHFSVKDIEISNSVPILRSIVSGLVLDVPFYLSPAHKEKMVKAVVREANRVYRLFCKRNPNFSGKVSIIAHSLGSCIAADILSNQPTFVSKPLDPAHDPDLTFCFNTRTLFLVGSPLAFFLHLGKGQVIARAKKERTKQVGKDIALDRAGRYGCMAVDAVYNVYHEADPVAFALNPCVDVRYSKLIKPVPIPSSNQTLLQNLSSAYYRVSKIFDFSSLWGSSTSTKPAAAESAPEQSGDQAKEQMEEQQKEVEGATRPPRLKRLPSEMPKFGMGRDELEWVGRAEQRMKALNPSGTVDYYLPAEGINQYVDALFSHGSYWDDPRFATFILSQLFASQEELERAVRDELGEVAEE
ncbi:putative carboxylic ester hydrolase [Sporobolomyces salmoneus]|uniref:putative carboxylic ester hydrolase n=1 Tax=Sporobolomyces salmoneus TaxID=183962 RepID=UPI00317A7B70